MHPLNAINHYVKSVCQQIRWKKAHARISEEMLNHVTDARDAYIKQGHDEPTATQKAITHTGDAIEIGTQLDRIHRPKPQWDMFMWVAGFLLLGVLLSYILFPGMDFSYGGPLFRLVWLVIGAAFMATAYFLDFSILGKHPRLCFIALFLFIMGLLFFTASHDAEWVSFPYLGVVHFRYVTLLFPVILVPVIYNARNKGFTGLISCLLVYSLLFLISAMAPGSWMSGFVHFVPVGFMLLVLAAARGWFGMRKLWATLGIVVPHVALFSFWISLMVQFSGGRNLLLDLINPHRVPDTRGFLPLQVRRLLNNATLLGEGTPDYLSDWFWPMRDMPQTLYNDYLLATVVFRFGWLAYAAIICAIVFFIVMAIKRCFKQKSSLGFFVSIAVILTFTMQVLTYTVTNFGFSIMHSSLPFLSSSNASIVVNMALVGLMLSVFRTGDAVADKYADAKVKPSGRVTWQDGTLRINFKRRIK